jgi:hypothetical protein
MEANPSAQRASDGLWTCTNAFIRPKMPEQQVPTSMYEPGLINLETDAYSDRYIASLHDRIRQLERACADSGKQPELTQDSSLLEVGDASTTAEDPTSAAAPAAPVANSSQFEQHGQSQSEIHEAAAIQLNSNMDPPSRPTDPTRPTPGQFIPDANQQHSPLPLRSDLYALASPPGPPSEVTAMGAIGTVIEDDESLDPTSSKKFYGSSSAASLMQLAHQSIKSGSTSSPNTQKSSPPKITPQCSTGGMPQTFHPAPGCTSLVLPPVDYSLPSRTLGDYLLERYKMRTYYLYPFIHWPTFYEAYESLWVSGGSRQDPGKRLNVGLGASANAGIHSGVFHCALNAMFAIGCHFSDMAYSEQEALATKFFLRAKQYVNLDLVDADNIGVVQALLVIAQLLQATSYPSRCWNSVGLACRIAQGLGLHSNQPASGSHPLELEMQRRVWHGCVMMDT